MVVWFKRMFEPRVRIRTEWRAMSDTERRAFDDAFKQMDKAFAAMRSAFDQVDR